MKKRIVSLLLALALLIGVPPRVITVVSAEVAGIDDLTCSSFIANTEHRTYIDQRMKQYLRNNDNLMKALELGKSVVMMFEGGSDNYPSHTYSSSGSNVRDQAVVIVLKVKDGRVQIVFYSEECSSIPAQPEDTTGGASNRQTTIMDGIYKIQTCNHHGEYGALYVVTSEGYYTPSGNKDGWVNTASGINIHTRSSKTAGSGDSAWSWGCQLIGNGNSSSNVFNSFMKAVANIDYNVWTSYSGKQFGKVTSGQDVGYYVLDRQLALDGLTALYNDYALSQITANSSDYYNCTLTIVANGGSCDTAKKTVIIDQEIGTLPTATLDDMCFEGWYTEPFGGTQITEDTVVSGSMTLYAHYSYPMSEVKLNFDPNGGVLPSAVYTDTVDGINTDRLSEYLVVYNQSGTQPGTTAYGNEIAVNSKGMITAVRRYGEDTKLTVPNGGFILSGHTGWDSNAGANVGGGVFVGKIADMEEAYVSFNYETGEVKAFDSYAGYLAETKRGREMTTLGVLPVPTRNGYVFDGWNSEAGKRVDYYTGFSGMNLTASWSAESSVSPVATMEYNGHYYELYDQNVTWTKAKSLCEAKGGYLVTITSASEQNAVVGLLAEGTRGLYRIGATDADGTWKWVTGETFSYTNWDPNYPEPSNGEGEYYSCIIAIENPPNKQVGEWVDDMDTTYGDFYDLSNTGFICEYDQRECQHEYTATTTEPTCTAAGYKVFTCVCGDSYREEIAPLGHSMVELAAVAPTCTATGLTAGTACSRCGEVGAAQTIVAALGHNMVEVPAKAPTCTATGLTAGTICDRCGEVGTAQTTVAATGHYYVNGVCRRCGKSDSIFTYEIIDSKVTITGFNTTVGGHVTIPETLEVYPVTAIGNYAFYNCDGMTGITIPDSVTSIGNGAFCGCTSLTGITIPDGVDSLGEDVFFNCTSLTAITIPDGVTSIGTYAFYGCTGLNGISIPVSVTQINQQAFWNCKGLTNVYYSGTESQWTKIDIASGNDLLTSATISYHNHCYEASTVEPSCTEKGYVEYTCSCGDSYQQSLSALGHSFTEYVDDGNATCTTNGTRTAKCDRCDKTDTVTEEGSILGHDYSVTVSVTAATCSERGRAVKKCSRCDSTDTTYTEALGHDMVEVPAVAPTCTAAGLTAGTACSRCDLIGTAQTTVDATGHSYVNGVCTGCGASNNIFVYEINNNEVTIYGLNTAVSGHITIPETLDGYPVTAIGKSTFKNQTAITGVSIPEGVTNIGAYAFSNCSGMTSIAIPNSVTNIGIQAFGSCTSLTNITIPDGVTSIENYVFYNCTGLVSITIPDSLIKIGVWAFATCRSLTSITIPEGVTSIGDSAFYYCNKLTSITLPNSLTSIDEDAFLNCTRLADVHYNGTSAQWEKVAIESGNDRLLNATLHTIELELVSIDTKTLPARRVYEIGESLNTAGLVLTATYSDGSTQELTEGFTISGFDSTTAGEKSVIVTYESFATTFKVLVVDSEVVYADGDLQETLSSAEAGTRVVLTKNESLATVSVWNDITLDLNGYTLTVDYFSCFGYVAENGDGGTGLIKVNKNIHIANQGSYLPIYDSTAGGYRFYSYTVKNLGAKVSEDTVKFGLQIKFANADAYRVLSDTENCGITAHAYVNWTGLGDANQVDFRFAAATVEEYAGKLQAAPEKNYAITLTLSGISALGENAWVSVAPVFETQIGIELIGEKVTWSAAA